MPDRVGVEGDVQASPGDSPPNNTVEGGTWAAAPVEYQPYPKLTIGGQSVIYEASCKFTYSGATKVSDGTPAPPLFETITLTAKTKKTQKGENFVLVDGDVKEGETTGNKLTVHTSNKLRTD